jgi:hypothetical protein
MAARDKRRQLGEDIHHARLAELRKGPEHGTWPAESLTRWRTIHTAARTVELAGVPLSRTEEYAREVVATADANGWP